LVSIDTSNQNLVVSFNDTELLERTGEPN